MTLVQFTAGQRARALAVSEDALVDSVKTALRLRRAPVAIVSTLDGDKPVGCAISAFLSLSLRPPSLLVSLRSSSMTLGHIRSSTRFGLSLLAERHAPLIDVFSRGRCHDRFRSTGFDVVHNVPLVEGAPAAFACTLSAQISIRDHTLIAGDILHVETATTRVSLTGDPSCPDSDHEEGGR
jgi:flavin reductase (DIM6/NTAB) family NADH-FMN oxidoreductase RutF